MDFFDRVRTSLKITFNQPREATSRQIRLHGLGAWAVGFVSIIVLSFAGPAIDRITFETDLEMIYIPTVLVAFGLMATGCYRALTGKKPSKDMDDYDVSPARIIVGVVSLLLSLMIPAAHIDGALYFLQMLGIEPNQIL